MWEERKSEKGGHNENIADEGRERGDKLRGGDRRREWVGRRERNRDDKSGR